MEEGLRIEVSKQEALLKVFHQKGEATELVMEASIVTGAAGSDTPSGSFTGGKWVKDKTNPRHGPVPWSKDCWANPYGPYFLPLNYARSGAYSTYGIHGTRGPLFGNFEKPPIPQSILSWFMDDDSARFLYASHGYRGHAGRLRQREDQDRNFMKLWLWVGGACVGLVAAFFTGRVTGALQRSLQSEADYPWALHRRIAAANINCSKLLGAHPTAPWYVERLKPDNALLVARYDRDQQTVTAVALDAAGREATDSWPLECGKASKK